MEDAVHAIIMAFSVIIFVLGLTVAVNMFSKVTTTAETLLYYTDKTNYFDNIELEKGQTNRIVDFDTIIPTLYRYYKENFCVKICDDTGSLIQIFDVNLEGEVRQASAVKDSNATKKQIGLKNLYNKEGEPQYMFEAPWIGSTDDNIKARIDYFVNGKSGYINNTYVDYSDNKFYKIRDYNKSATSENKIYFSEDFISYAYTGDTITNDEGEILVDGQSKPKDKIIIVYRATKAIPK